MQSHACSKTFDHMDGVVISCKGPTVRTLPLASRLEVLDMPLIRSDQIISHLFQPHQADQMFDPHMGSSFANTH